MAKYIYTDGETIKGFDIPVSLDSDLGWDVYGTPKHRMKEDEFAARVAAAYRARDLNADALASLPFSLVDRAGNEYATSQDWEDEGNEFREVMPRPRQLIKLWRKSLSMRNVAYGFVEKKRGTMQIRYIMPDTMEIDSNPNDGIVGFWRKRGATRQYYRVSQNVILPIIRTDWDTEILPSENTEFRALADAAGILYHSNRYVKEFFSRNAIKPHMLMVKGTPQEAERKRLENVFTRMMLGLYQSFGKVFNFESVEPVQLGSGVDDFKDNGFYRQALEDIAIASGIPLSLLLSNSANLATARTEYKSWYDNRIIPDALFLQGELNDQFFHRFDMRLEFRPEDTDPDQEEEVRRSQSVVNIVSAMKESPETALAIMTTIFGYDITEQEEAELLKVANAEKEKRMQEQQEQFEQRRITQDQNRQQARQSPQAEQGVDENKGVTLDADQINELATWQDIARRKVNKGQTLTLPLTAKYLPADIAALVNSRLEGVTDIAGVKQAFDLSTTTETQEYKSEIVALAQAINKLAEKDNNARRDEPQP